MKTRADAILETVNRVMMEEFEAPPEKLRPEARLRDDLGMDSLDGVDLVVALEVAFGFRIPEQQARGIRTLGDVYERIRAHVGG
ncbi:MAG: acyl carrier protein [Candidatus Rokubacteria bacterium]|nr:acyl carrier protein [Candidatus Rokubacteria bacterium]